MLKFYLKQALYDIKEHKLVSFISIAGTALAICMIMVNVVAERSAIDPFRPEVNRNRILYAPFMSATNLEQNFTVNNAMSIRTAKACFLDLTLPEEKTLYSSNWKMILSIPATRKISGQVKKTDDAFWRVFRFDFIRGKPYNKAESDAGMAKAVITESVAKRLFNSVDVVGNTFQIDYVDYRVGGVVKDVSRLATVAFADVWIPYNSTETFSSWDGIMGEYSVALLATGKKDFSRIREESEQLKKKYNATLPGWELVYRGQPHTQEEMVNRPYADTSPDMHAARKRMYYTLLVLLLVPTVNLCAMSIARIAGRMPEMGIRKAFGARKSGLLGQVFCENLVLTFIGGVIGLALCYLFLVLFNHTIFSSEEYSELPWDMVLNPFLFLLVFLFCLLMNLLCSLIPAIKAVCANITETLKI